MNNSVLTHFNNNCFPNEVISTDKENESGLLTYNGQPTAEEYCDTEQDTKEKLWTDAATMFLIHKYDENQK